MEADGGAPSWMTLLESQTAGVRSGAFSVGDTVIIRAGDLAGLKAKVTALDGKVVLVLPEGLQRDVNVNAGDLVKFFEVGDSVRAIAGPNQGKSGLVTTIDLQKCVASVFWPEQNRPFSCALDSLQLCPSSGLGSGGISSLRGFSVGDLVQLSDLDTAIITRIDPGRTFSVLNAENRADVVPLSKIGRSIDPCNDQFHVRLVGEVTWMAMKSPIWSVSSYVTPDYIHAITRSCVLSASKRSNDFALANDATGLQFGVRASVVLLDPLCKDMQARVCHIWKQNVFVKLSSRDAANNGYLVCPSKDLRVSSSDGTAFYMSPGARGGQFDGGRGGKFMRGRGGRGLRGRRVKLTGTRQKGFFGVVEVHEGETFKIRPDCGGLLINAGKNDFVLVDSYGGGGGRGGYGGRGRGRGGGGRGGYQHNASSQQGSSAPQEKPKASNDSWESFFDGVKDPWFS